MTKIKAAGEDLRNVAIRCDLNPTRVTEVHKKNAMSEITFKKLLQGGIVNVGEVIKIQCLNKEHIDYLKTFICYSKVLHTAILSAHEKGYTGNDIAKMIEENLKSTKQ